MAEARETGAKFYCHRCEGDVTPNLTDYTCMNCQSGCIEEISPGNSQQSNATQNNLQAVFPWEGMRFNVLNYGGPSDRFEMLTSQSQPSEQNTSASGMRSFESPNGLALFIQQFFSNLGVHVPDDGEAPSAMPLVKDNDKKLGGFFPGNFNDYAWGPNGIDNIISQLLNQLDNVGAPPADGNKINSLPQEIITQEDIEKNASCPVCLEEFSLDLKVKKLPCFHRFHGACIDSWLSKHDSCPVCRKNLDGNVYAESS